MPQWFNVRKVRSRYDREDAAVYIDLLGVKLNNQPVKSSVYPVIANLFAAKKRVTIFLDNRVYAVKDGDELVMSDRFFSELDSTLVRVMGHAN